MLGSDEEPVFDSELGGAEGELVEELFEALGLVLRFEKFPANVGVAAHEGDVIFAFGPRGVSAVAVALDDGGVRGSAWIAVEEVGNAALVTTFAPMINNASAGNVGDPEVAGFGFTVTGLEIVNGGFVELAVGASPVFVLNFAVDDGEPVEC